MADYNEADPLVAVAVTFARDHDIPGVEEHVDYLAEILSDQRQRMQGKGSSVETAE